MIPVKQNEGGKPATELRDVAQAMQVSAERAKRREAVAREAQHQL